MGSRPPGAAIQAGSFSAGNEVVVPDATGLRAARPISTQEAFGRILVDLSRAEAVGPLPGDHRAGRGDLDEPGRLHQPDRACSARCRAVPGATTRC